MFNWFKKFFNPQQSRPANYIDLTVMRARHMVACTSSYQNEFFSYNTELIDAKERPDWCQIVMSKDGYTVVNSFDKRILYNIDTMEELWEVLRPQLLICKRNIDKQMKQPFIDISYKKFTELNPNLTTNQ